VNDDASLFIQLYLDEDVHKRVAAALRLRHFDVLSAHEIDRLGADDDTQLRFAAEHGRALLTFNTTHYLPSPGLAPREQSARWSHRVRPTPDRRDHPPPAQSAESRHCRQNSQSIVLAAEFQMTDPEEIHFSFSLWPRAWCCSIKAGDNCTKQGGRYGWSTRWDQNS